MTVFDTVFDEAERRAWAGRAEAYAGSFARLCAYPVPALLDAADVRAGTRVLDAGTGTGAAALCARERGAAVWAADADPGMAAVAADTVPPARVAAAALPQLPFRDGEFDAAVGNFVLNHTGRPLAALAELRRVTRVGGRVAVTIWAAPPAPGQALFGRALQEAGAVRPAYLPPLAPEDDFPRTEAGLTGLLRSAGLTEPACATLAWDHRADREEWWSGPAAGVASVGQVLISQSPVTAARVRRRFDALAREFTGADGLLVLPHTALLAAGRR